MVHVLSALALYLLILASNASPIDLSLEEEILTEKEREEVLTEPVYQLHTQWHIWKARHTRTYGSSQEDIERHLIWLSNLKYIEGHNANHHVFGYRLSMNQYGDMTDLEYKTNILTYSMSNHSSEDDDPRVTRYVPDSNYQIPESIDWRSQSAVTPIKDQGDCGSSYAFSTTGSIEGAVALGYGRLVSLSEQNIIDCSVSLGNTGCNGGNMYNSYMYIIDNEGIDITTAYPYQGSQMGCRFDKDGIGADITGIIAITSGCEYHLLSAVATAGPISVAVDGSSNSFRFYEEGILDTFQCSSFDVNHAMTLVGYGEYNGKEYWIVKNSWGKGWGMDGYILMTRNYYNQCGIATDASYPRL